MDDLCLVNLLKASCLKWMDSPLQAEECLRTVVGNASKLEVKFKINSNMCTCIWKIEMGIIAGRHLPCPLLPLRAGRAIEGAGAGGAGGGDAGGGKVKERIIPQTKINNCCIPSRNDYKDYSLQNRLHFRIHAAQAEMKQNGRRKNKGGGEGKKNRKKKAERCMSFYLFLLMLLFFVGFVAVTDVASVVVAASALLLQQFLLLLLLLL